MNPPIELPAGALTSATLGQGLTLDQFQPGDRGQIRAVRGKGAMRQRLLEMGFVSGTEVRVVRLAPLADPMEVALHGYHVSLRRSDAAAVLVDRVD